MCTVAGSLGLRCTPILGMVGKFLRQHPSAHCLSCRYCRHLMEAWPAAAEARPTPSSPPMGPAMGVAHDTRSAMPAACGGRTVQQANVALVSVSCLQPCTLQLPTNRASTKAKCRRPHLRCRQAACVCSHGDAGLQQEGHHRLEGSRQLAPRFSVAGGMGKADKFEQTAGGGRAAGAAAVQAGLAVCRLGPFASPARDDQFVLPLPAHRAGCRQLQLLALGCRLSGCAAQLLSNAGRELIAAKCSARGLSQPRICRHAGRGPSGSNRTVHCL